MSKQLVYCVTVETSLSDHISDADFAQRFEHAAEAASDDVDNMYFYYTQWTTWASSANLQKLQPFKSLCESELGPEHVRIESVYETIADV